MTRRLAEERSKDEQAPDQTPEPAAVPLDEPAPDAEPQTPAEAPEPEQPSEDALAEDVDELSALARERDEYLELAQRTRADFENYRKRVARESAEAERRGVVRLAERLLPPIDNLERALGSTDDGSDLANGVRMVHEELVGALRQAGVEDFAPEGEDFDPSEHEAVSTAPAGGVEPGTVVEVLQKGYRLDGKVLRAARVVVAK